MKEHKHTTKIKYAKVIESAWYKPVHTSLEVQHVKLFGQVISQTSQWDNNENIQQHKTKTTGCLQRFEMQNGMSNLSPCPKVKTETTCYFNTG